MNDIDRDFNSGPLKSPLPRDVRKADFKWRCFVCHAMEPPGTTYAWYFKPNKGSDDRDWKSHVHHWKDAEWECHNHMSVEDYWNTEPKLAEYDFEDGDPVDQDDQISDRPMELLPATSGHMANFHRFPAVFSEGNDVIVDLLKIEFIEDKKQWCVLHMSSGENVSVSKPGDQVLSLLEDS